ncbi:hypothetical protein Q2T40_12230 [Winogradskyella maritima]|uniref:Uncharacterized protein n=1 Tax=Winogradskyella maritima TaxID=1517766 RepID=A0ABV8AJ93_9FLAO|nr:hypothetical protein [Winogradskyella maritima]
MEHYQEELQTKALIDRIEPHYNKLEEADRLKYDVIKQTVNGNTLEHSGYDDILETLNTLEQRILRD